MNNDHLDTMARRLEDFIRKQRHHCFTDHRRRSHLLRIRPEDRETLILAQSADYGLPYRSEDERYWGMKVIVDDTCVDGPVVECESFWEHGRDKPWGRVDA